MPRSVSQMFPSRWLRAADLPRAVTVKIISVDVQEMRQVDGTRAWKALLGFEGKEKRLIVNKTQAEALARLTGSEQLAEWIGHTVRLAPGTAHNGRGTIAILAAEQPAVPTNGASSEPEA